MKGERMMEYSRNLLRYAVVVSVTAMPLAAAGQGTVTIKVDPQQVDFLSGSELVTRYHKGPDAAKPFFWPVNGTRGVPLTRAWPMEKAAPGGSIDHVHQKSLWFTHGDVIPEGLEIKK